MPDSDFLPPAPQPPAEAASVAAGARNRRRWTSVALAVEPPGDGPPPPVRYEWDADTEIPAASVADRRGGGAAAASLELEGRDGSWVTLEVRAGRLCGLEVAVWPPVRLRTALAPPGASERGHVSMPALGALGALGGTTDVEVDTLLHVESDRRQRTYHFRVGRPRPTRAVQVGRDILVDVDEAGELAGLWLLNVPPQPVPH
ncbi:hypothetical protein [Roseisolibacter sp. H3M3-2]|uniref:hypothetical protein n=1 Tax=Roseisolibacter sp. H3M3-2 TaxID=3031323 RepID=UPI0023DA4C1A|nr:hypothetical protein [Roseisolibacter sp. H3M3-2]MDF1504568.1 hypothetical protein [Roseisolibacter sp. H3M3-2]